jgi:hypothetical protein
MSQLPLWPPLAAIAFAVIGYAILRFFSNRLEREEQEARRQHSPAE